MARRTVFDMLSGMVAKELEPLKQHLTKKARREWADKLAVKKYGNKGWHLPYAEGLKFEHARVVRIVKRLQKNAERGGFGLAYGVALKDVLAALTKGRA